MEAVNCDCLLFFNLYEFDYEYFDYEYFDTAHTHDDDDDVKKQDNIILTHVCASSFDHTDKSDERTNSICDYPRVL